MHRHHQILSNNTTELLPRHNTKTMAKQKNRTEKNMTEKKTNHQHQEAPLDFDEREEAVLTFSRTASGAVHLTGIFELPSP